MFNPIQAALNSKLGMKLQGKSVVDNAANPASAYSMKQRAMKNSGSGRNAQTEAVQRGIDKAYGPKSTVKKFGTPLQ